MYEGRWTDARMILQKGIDLDLENNWTYYAAHKYIMLAQVYSNQNKTSLALKALERALAENKGVEVLFSSAQAYLSLGREEKALSLVAELSTRLQPEPQAYAKLIRGEMKLAENKVPEAIQLFQEAQNLVDSWLGRFALGKAYLNAKAFTEAHSEFELCLKRQGEAASVLLDDLPSFRYLPPVYYFLGQTQEGLDSPAASESYQKFLTIKEKSDQDPLVKDARRRLNTK
jgi:predicted Zn-dependent protease